MSHFLLQINLGALLTASLAHTSFEKAVEISYMQLGFHDCVKCYLNNKFLLILGVAVRSGRLLSLAKAGWELESLWRNISAKIRVYTYLYLGGTLFVNWYRK